MPDKTEVVSADTKASSSEEFAMLLHKTGADNYSPTPEQVDLILKRQDKVTDYVHAERMQTHTNNRYYVTIGTVLILLISGGVLFFQPDYFSETLAGLLGIASGYGARGFRLAA